MAARPLGIKLHAELSYLYGQLLLHVMRAGVAVTQPLWRLFAPWVLAALAVLGILFGEFFYELHVDCLPLESLCGGWRLFAPWVLAALAVLGILFGEEDIF